MEGLASLKPDFLGARLPADLLQGCGLEDIWTTFQLSGGVMYSGRLKHGWSIKSCR